MSNFTEDITSKLRCVASGTLSSHDSADQIAQTVLQSPDLGASLDELWSEVIRLASFPSTSTSQQHLADTLIALSQQPDAQDSSGSPLEVSSMQVWRDMPTLGWQINGIWNGFNPSPRQPQRRKDITNFVNAVRFTALLVRSDQPFARPYRLQILWTFRGLESATTTDQSGSGATDLDVTVPAVAAVVDVLGDSVGSWDDDYKSDPKTGAPGRGGPLWDGKQGFSPERYALWKRRLGEIAGQEGVDADIRKVAGEVVQKM